MLTNLLVWPWPACSGTDTNALTHTIHLIPCWVNAGHEQPSPQKHKHWTLANFQALWCISAKVHFLLVVAWDRIDLNEQAALSYLRLEVRFSVMRTYRKSVKLTFSFAAAVLSDIDHTSPQLNKRHRFIWKSMYLNGMRMQRPWKWLHMRLFFFWQMKKAFIVAAVVLCVANGARWRQMDEGFVGVWARLQGAALGVNIFIYL